METRIHRPVQMDFSPTMESGDFYSGPLNLYYIDPTVGGSPAVDNTALLYEYLEIRWNGFSNTVLDQDTAEIYAYLDTVYTPKDDGRTVGFIFVIPLIATSKSMIYYEQIDSFSNVEWPVSYWQMQNNTGTVLGRDGAATFIDYADFDWSNSLPSAAGGSHTVTLAVGGKQLVVKGTISGTDDFGAIMLFLRRRLFSVTMGPGAPYTYDIREDYAEVDCYGDAPTNWNPVDHGWYWIFEGAPT